MPIDNPPVIVKPRPSNHRQNRPALQQLAPHPAIYSEPVHEPIEGLGQWDPAHVMFKGSTMRADVADALTDAQISRGLQAASSVTFTLADPHRRLVQSDIFSERATLVLDGMLFELVGTSKSGTDLTVVFEDAGAFDLKHATKHLVAAVQSTTRVEFARKLVDEVPWLGFRGDDLAHDDTQIREKLQVGARKHGHKTSSTTKGAKNAWAALQALAQERNWECFLDQGIVWFGSDFWLKGLGEPLVISEEQDEIVSIDFNADTGKRASTATVTAYAHRWFARPGKPVEIDGLGPLVDKDSGAWLVSQIDRSLYDPTATITLKRPTHELKEPRPQATGGSSIFGAVGLGGSKKADAFANYVMKFRGDRYTWGGTNPQTGFDCSGIILFSLHHFGISYPRTAGEQYATAKHVDVATAVGIKGALLYHPPGFGGDPSEHIAVSLGNGSTIEARGSQYGVVVVPQADQRFNKGALVQELGPYHRNAGSLFGNGITPQELKMFNKMGADAKGVQRKIRAIWGTHADIGIAIASCESASGQNVDGHGNRVGCNPSGLGCGVMQINPKAHGNWDRTRLATDQAFNIWCGYQLFKTQGTTPWVSSESCWRPLLHNRP